MGHGLGGRGEQGTYVKLSMIKKLKATNKQGKEIKTYRHRQQYGCYQREGVWGGIYMVMEKNLTLGSGQLQMIYHRTVHLKPM